MIRAIFFLFAAFGILRAAVPENLTVEGVPEIPAELQEDVSRYLEFRGASFEGWHPKRREMLITTRFAETPQLHTLRAPGGARRQLTFLREPVRGGGWRPKTGEMLVFGQDKGGSEAYQFYRMDSVTGRVTLLTDGKSRNTGALWSHDGRLLAFTSTARNSHDNDIWLLDPDKPAERRLLSEVNGGGWGVSDWSHDGTTLLLTEFFSATESKLWLCDVKSGKRERLTPEQETPVSREGAVFSKDGKEIFLASNEGGEFKQLGRMSLTEKKFIPMAPGIPWDVEAMELSPDGKLIALVTNEDGLSRLRFVTTDGSPAPAAPALPSGVVTGLGWTEDSKELGFSMTGARSPADAWSLDPSTGALHRWTESETGGLDASRLIEP
jgi:Tol biopolymer transport system component